MSIFEFYLLTVVAPGLSTFGTAVSAIIAIVMAAAVGVGIMAICIEKVPPERIFQPKVIATLRWVAVVWMVGTLLSVTMPDYKRANLLAGAAVMVNIDGIEDLPPNLVKAANAYLEAVTEAKVVSKE